MTQQPKLLLPVFAALLAVAMPWAAHAQSIAAWQQRIFDALVRQRVLIPETRLVSLKPICTLFVDKWNWQVIDVVEHVPGAEVPRGRSRIILLDRNLKLVRALDYASEYPMACIGSRLFVWGDYGIDNAAPYGNVLDFQADGRIIVTHVEANDLPIPPTRDRLTFRLP